MRKFVALLMAITLAACGSESLELSALENSPILQAEIPGFSGGRATERTAGSITKLFDVAGSWEDASVALAKAVKAHGWLVESINCVGTGNDVIARRQINGTWVLLESGAGAGGAGMILSIGSNPGSPSSLEVTGSCPQALIEAAGS